MNFVLGFAVGEVFAVLILYMGYNWHCFKAGRK